MKEFIENLEKISQCKICLYYDGKRYGTYESKEKNEEQKSLSVEDFQKYELIKKIVFDYIEKLDEIDQMTHKLYHNYEKIYSLLEISKLPIENISDRELIMVYLKIAKNILGYKTAYVYYENLNDIIHNGKLLHEPSEIEKMIHKAEKTIEPKCFKDEYTEIAYEVNEKLKLIMVFEKVEKKSELIENIKILSEILNVVLKEHNYKEEIEDIYINLLKEIAMVVERRNHIYGNRTDMDTVVRLTIFLSKKMNLDRNEVRALLISIILRDIGTILISENILHKRDNLNRIEETIISRHPEYSSKLLKTSHYFYVYEEVVKHHHERWDGKGYPDGLKKEEIPFFSRVISLIDTFCAMISKRVFRDDQEYSLDEAREYILKERGEKFDPKLVDTFIENFDEVKKILEKSS